MKRIRIIGDGSLRGTHISDAETGEKIQNVTAVRFLAVGRFLHCELTQHCAVDAIDMVGDVPGSSEPVQASTPFGEKNTTGGA